MLGRSGDIPPKIILRIASRSVACPQTMAQGWFALEAFKKSSTWTKSSKMHTNSSQQPVQSFDGLQFTRTLCPTQSGVQFVYIGQKHAVDSEQIRSRTQVRPHLRDWLRGLWLRRGGSSRDKSLSLSRRRRARSSTVGCDRRSVHLVQNVAVWRPQRIRRNRQQRAGALFECSGIYRVSERRYAIRDCAHTLPVEFQFQVEYVRRLGPTKTGDKSVGFDWPRSVRPSSWSPAGPCTHGHHQCVIRSWGDGSL